MEGVRPGPQKFQLHLTLTLLEICGQNQEIDIMRTCSHNQCLLQQHILRNLVCQIAGYAPDTHSKTMHMLTGNLNCSRRTEHRRSSIRCHENLSSMIFKINDTTSSASKISKFAQCLKLYHQMFSSSHLPQSLHSSDQSISLLNFQYLLPLM